MVFTTHTARVKKQIQGQSNLGFDAQVVKSRTVKKFQQQHGAYTSVLHSAILEIGRRMSSKMSSNSLSASDSVAHSWIQFYDLMWRREIRHASRSLPSLVLLAQTLKFISLRFSVLSPEDCLNALPENRRTPIPRVGQRLILDTSKYADYLALDSTFVQKKNAQQRALARKKKKSGIVPSLSDRSTISSLASVTVPGASRVHDCLSKDLLLDCVVSHVLTRSGGGNPYCLVFLSRPEIDSGLPPLFPSAGIASDHGITLNKNSLLNQSIDTNHARIRAAALAKAAESGVDNSDGRFGRIHYDAEQAQKDAEKRRALNPNDPTPWHCPGCKRKFKQQRGLSRHVLCCKGVIAKTKADKDAEKRKERAEQRARRNAAKAKAKAEADALKPAARQRALLKAASPEQLALIKDLKKVLADMRKHEFVEPFLLPVDTSEVHDYADYIKLPMSVQILAKKNRYVQYPTVESFRYDLDLIQSNCELYCGIKLKDMESKRGEHSKKKHSIGTNKSSSRVDDDGDTIKSQMKLYKEFRNSLSFKSCTQPSCKIMDKITGL